MLADPPRCLVVPGGSFAHLIAADNPLDSTFSRVGAERKTWKSYDSILLGRLEPSDCANRTIHPE